MITQEQLDSHRLYLVSGGWDGSRLVLINADLRSVNLSHADLREADLVETDLSSANLRGATMSKADLRKAKLIHADLSCADLQLADLSNADLRCANLSAANLDGVNLGGANLGGAIGNGKEVRSGQLNIFAFVCTTSFLWINTQCKPIAEWWDCELPDLSENDRAEWLRVRDWLKQTIDLFPANSTRMEGNDASH